MGLPLYLAGDWYPLGGDRVPKIHWWCRICDRFLLSQAQKLNIEIEQKDWSLR